MTTATISEAKANLPKLIRKARKGEIIVLTSDRTNVPVAQIEPYVEIPDLRSFTISWSPLPDEDLPDYIGEDVDDL